MNYKERLCSGCMDEILRALYGRDGLSAGRQRALTVLEQFAAHFPERQAEAVLFSAPGRTELGGNHTDHQHGCVLCGSVDLDILACAAPNAANCIRVISEGYPPVEVVLDNLQPCAAEMNTSAALIRGVAAKITALGYRVMGLDICMTSNVLSGSGLSSSAAYEILMGTVVNHFCCENALDAVQIARIGQWAENVFFGKPCGLMDQMACSVGGAVAIDFADPAAPVVEQVAFDFDGCGYALCIMDTRSSHDDLTEDYAAIPREMGEVAAFFGKQVLRDVPEGDFWANLTALRRACGDRAVLRTIHFFRENRRAQEEAQALKRGDFAAFLALVNASGHSSELLLQNIWTPSHPRAQAVSLALEYGRVLLAGEGAIRVHGGGFAGTIQAFVPRNMVVRFRQGMETLFGEGSCHILRIRPVGGIVLN